MNEIRNIYSKNVAIIVEASEHHKPPFSAYKYESVYDKYLPVLKKLDREDRIDAENVLMEYSKSTIIVDYAIKDGTLRKYERLNKELCMIPEIQRFEFNPNITPPITLKSHEVNQIIAKYMSECFPSYRPDKELISIVPKEAIVYNKLIGKDIDVVMFFDKGSLASPRVTPYLGIKKPAIYIEVGKLIGHPDWNPFDLVSAESMISQMFMYLETVYPFFEKIITNES